MNASIETLKERLGEVADVAAVIALLEWDQEVNLPPKAEPGRGQHLATLSGIHHRMFTDPELGTMLEELAAKGLQGDDALLVSETRYDYDKETKLPESLVQKMAQHQSRCLSSWARARAASDFSQFKDDLGTMIDLLRQKADCLGYEDSPYDALLNEYERGETTTHVREVFGELAREQSELVAQIMKSPHQPDTEWADQTWDESAQLAFTLRVLEDMGYDFDAGRQDKSVHPFTTNFDIYDVRVTTRVSERELFSALTGSVHEGGHGLYEQGFLESDRRSPLGTAISLGIHESQSRMWENVIGRSRPFWEHYAPIMRDFYPGQLSSVDVDDIHRAINKVEPSFIRVEADECTYNLHVILRFELEVDILEGNIAIADIPEAWNAKMKQYLGLDVTDDALGCLQDVHWAHGLFGYFPTYALGNLHAAQMFEVIERDLPTLWDNVGKGDFSGLLEWLRVHVHRVGRRRLAGQLIEDISGRPLEAKPYLDYLRTKYGALYQL